MQSLPSTAQSYQQAENKVSGLLDQISSFLQEDETPQSPVPQEFEALDSGSLEAIASNLVLFPRSTSLAPEPMAPPPREDMREPEPERSPSLSPLNPATEAELEQRIAELLKILAPEASRHSTLTALQQLLVLLGGDVPPPHPAIAQDVTTLKTQYTELQIQLNRLESRLDEAVEWIAVPTPPSPEIIPAPTPAIASPDVVQDRETRPESAALPLVEESVTSESSTAQQPLDSSAVEKIQIAAPVLQQDELEMAEAEAIAPSSVMEAQATSLDEESQLAIAPPTHPETEMTVLEPEPGSEAIAPDSLVVTPALVAPGTDDSALPAEVPPLRSEDAPIVSPPDPPTSDLPLALNESEPPFAVVTTPSEHSDSTLPTAPPRQTRFTQRLLIGLGVIGLLGASWGLYRLFIHPQRTLETQLTHTFAADPQLAVYRLEADVTRNTVKLVGTLPNRQLRDHAKDIITQLAPQFQLQDQTIVVDTAVAQAVTQMAQTLNQIEGVDLKASFEAGEVVLSGTTMYPSGRARLAASFTQLPGVETVENLLKVQPVSIPTRIYFAHNATQLQNQDIVAKIAPLAQLLKTQPQLTIRIVGYSHSSESNSGTIAQARAQAVQTLLEDQGVDRRRLQLTSQTSNPPGMAKGGDRWLGRCVLFEVIPPQ